MFNIKMSYTAVQEWHTHQPPFTTVIPDYVLCKADRALLETVDYVGAPPDQLFQMTMQQLLLLDIMMGRLAQKGIQLQRFACAIEQLPAGVLDCVSKKHRVVFE